MSVLHVVAPGALSSVQDLGRPGHAAMGVSASGAADALSLEIGNRLVGNDPSCAAIEMTLVGGTLRLDAAAIVAITGSDFPAVIASASGAERALARWEAASVAAGESIRIGPTRSGARCYLCVRGGIDVDPVLGSRSTHLLTGIGGHHGRALRAGDELPVGSAVAGPPRPLRVAPSAIDRTLARRSLRTVAGPQLDRFVPRSVAEFHATEWEVSEEADRTGLRLRGPALARRDERQLLTEGVCLGAIQVPDGGQPIVLLVEQQTTGGYPKVASVIAADLPAVGQLRPRDRVRFSPVTPGQARAELAALRRLVAGAFEPA